MNISAITAAQFREAVAWKRVDKYHIDDDLRDEYVTRCDALGDVIHGTSIRNAANEHELNRTTLTSTILKAFSIGPDGLPYGYRACIPYHIRRSQSKRIEYPASGGPYAVTKLISFYPEIGKMLDTHKGPLGPGRLPSRFKRILQDIRVFLKERGHGEQWPFTLSDKGRREFARHLRRKRECEAELGAAALATLTSPKFKRLDDLFALAPFDRVEFDEHQKDIDFVLRMPHALHDYVDVPISKVGILAQVDTKSGANPSWSIVFGGFTSLDVLECYAKGFEPWSPRELVVQGMHYKEGASMPSNVPFGPMSPRMICLDNHSTHINDLPLNQWAECADVVINVGKRHLPEARPYIEGFFKWIEENGLRQMPGGYEPAKGRGDKTFTSSEPAKKHPLHIQALEDVMDVLITERHVQRKSGTYQNSPMDILNEYAASPYFWLPSMHSEEDIKALTSEVRTVVLRGKRKIKPVHVNLYGVKYRSAALDNCWDLLCKNYRALINLKDLRTITLLDNDYKPFATMVAAHPWHLTQHDVTTRKRIIRLSNKGLIDLEATHCAIAAYATYTLLHAGENKAIADQAARLIQLANHGQLQSNSEATDHSMSTTLSSPRRDPVHFSYSKEE